MAVTEERVIRLEREALAEAVSRDGALAPGGVLLDVPRQMLRVTRADGAVQELSGAGLAVLILRHLARLRVPVPRDADKRVAVGEEGVSLIMRRLHRVRT